jgi:hypothetical protein
LAKPSSGFGIEVSSAKALEDRGSASWARTMQEVLDRIRQRAAPVTATADFVSDQIDRFGILGTNNIVPDELKLGALPSPSCQFTKDNHFRFGFNGVEFNRRLSRAATYWVEFGRPSRLHQGFPAEMRRALLEIHEIYGRLSITNSGNSISRGVMLLAKELGLELKLVSVEFDGHPAPVYDGAWPHRLHKVAWDDFAKFAHAFGQTAGCSSPWVALEAYHGSLSDLPHIYTSTTTLVVDHNVETRQYTRFGPPNWALGSPEMNTAINRWLLACGKAGVPQIMRWSPELMAAQIDSDLARGHLQAASTPPDASVQEDDLRKSEAPPFDLFQQLFPDVPMAPVTSRARNDEALNGKMRRLRRMMVRANPRCDTTHFIPLHRLLRHLGVEFDFYFEEPQQLYGRVDAMGADDAG